MRVAILAFPRRGASLFRAMLLVALSVSWLLLAPEAAAQRGNLVLQQNLAELVEQAETIIRGHVTSARVEPHPDFKNIYTVVVTVKVEKTLKGEAQPTFTFRMFISDIRDRFDAAGYHKEQHLLLLMIKPSQYGLSSPAGLEQGRFRIERDPQGNDVAVNGHANLGLFREMDTQLARKGVKLAPELSTVVATHRTGPISLPQLEGIIRSLAGEQ